SYYTLYFYSSIHNRDLLSFPTRRSSDLDTDQLVNVLLPSLQSIRRVNVILVLRSTEIDRRNGRPARFGIQSSFAPRNISYTTNQDRKSTRLNSSHVAISYAVFCLKKKNK